MTRPAVPRAPDTPPTTDGMHDLRVTRYGFLLLDDFSLIALGSGCRSVAHREHDRRAPGLRVRADRRDRRSRAFERRHPRRARYRDGRWRRFRCGVRRRSESDSDARASARCSTGCACRRVTAWRSADSIRAATFSRARACSTAIGARFTGRIRTPSSSSFRSLTVSNRLYEVDRDRYTCSGGVAPLDLMVHLLGAATRQPVARGARARIARRGTAQSRAAAAHVAAPIHGRRAREARRSAAGTWRAMSKRRSRVAEIAAYLEVSQRQLERWFQERFGKTPAQAYIEIRLLRARQLLYRTVEAARRGVHAHRLHIDDAFRHAL